MKIKPQKFSISLALKSQVPLMAHKVSHGLFPGSSLTSLPFTLPLTHSVPEKWPPSCFSNTPVMFPPQGLCTEP